MARDLLNRYIWLIDTIRRYGRISRSELNKCWMRSGFSDGSTPMPRRTFYNYRHAVEELFDIEIGYDPATFEYFIVEDADTRGEVTEWLLDSAATSELLSNARDVGERIFLENVPSAREHLVSVVEALRAYLPIVFDYQPYTRSTPTRNVELEPYFLKIFKQRWYITGRHTAENRIKTYALDRMLSLRLSTSTFEPDPGFDPREYFRYSFGIVFTAGEVKDVVLRVDPRQAKYMRALPLHHSQVEFVHDGFSLFRYRMRISPDLVEEILSHGPRMTVLEPPELRAAIVDELENSLRNYL
ncbi:MAG: WYL domain-containing protein [Muribaculaceae bacterium]|nr:WYL domain-containing protein [Muribaculaceae bacterium]